MDETPSARSERSFGNGRMAAGIGALPRSLYAAVSERASPREPATTAYGAEGRNSASLPELCYFG